PFAFRSIRHYADAVGGNTFHRLTDQTQEDIDLHGLFACIDRTTSKVGQQFLFKKLIEPTNLPHDPSQPFIEFFAANPNTREEIQLELTKLNHPDAYLIPTLLQNKLLKRPRWFSFLFAYIAAVVCLILVSFKFPVLAIGLIIPIAINMHIHYWNKGNTFQFLRSFPQLNLLINVSKAISTKGELFRNQAVEKSIADLKSFQQKVSLIQLEGSGGLQGELSQLATYLIEIIKAVLLVEVFVLFRVTRELENKQSAILILFDYIGSLDASLSVASLRAGTLKTCVPLLTSAKKEIIVKGLYHPLIDNCVANDLSIRGKSILITGSNMSGKSTFLRALMINSILAQTIHTCFAEEFTAPILKQYSSIRIDDNLFEGKSYYFQEVNIMGSLLAEVESSHQNLFVLDEVFKGTNTVERIAAAKAVLAYLNRHHHIVIVSTHDIELVELLADDYDLYHFTETIEADTLHFDHKIKPGPITTRNAIRLLELSNYPDAVIREAQRISATLKLPGTSSGE
ncbi:MAG: DNA mismatch repair protein MutS, partial [Cyclobacteriaceae bacterium]|nr:DNA mismatch repair protein MutS [Cyclobacteriaceae bacterium]